MWAFKCLLFFQDPLITQYRLLSTVDKLLTRTSGLNEPCRELHSPSCCSLPAFLWGLPTNPWEAFVWGRIFHSWKWFLSSFLCKELLKDFTHMSNIAWPFSFFLQKYLLIWSKGILSYFIYHSIVTNNRFEVRKHALQTSHLLGVCPH